MPVAVAVISCVIYKEKLPKSTICSSIITLCGIILVIKPSIFLGPDYNQQINESQNIDHPRNKMSGFILGLTFVIFESIGRC